MKKTMKVNVRNITRAPERPLILKVSAEKEGIYPKNITIPCSESRTVEMTEAQYSKQKDALVRWEKADMIIVTIVKDDPAPEAPEAPKAPKDTEDADKPEPKKAGRPKVSKAKKADK